MTLSIPFTYSDSEDPQVPLVSLVIESHFGLKENLKGKIDTGASITIIPERIRKKLELQETGTRNVGGPFSKPEPRSTYEVKFTINDIEFEIMPVISRPRPNVLLGRDLINLWDIKLEPKNKMGIATPWSKNPEDVKSR